MMLDITGIMDKLSRDHPIFHSEADFQHALAWRVHKEVPDCQVRLEFKLLLNENERIYLDIYLPSIGVAIELKYKTRKLDPKSLEFVNDFGESYELGDQAAQDFGRYDFIKDIYRLKQMSDFKQVTGFAILLTNDPTYWKPSLKRVTRDTAFRIDEGKKKIEGTMMWNGKEPQLKRKYPIDLNGSYDICWQNYSFLKDMKYGQFRYLMVRVPC